MISQKDCAEERGLTADYQYLRDKQRHGDQGERAAERSGMGGTGKSKATRSPRSSADSPNGAKED